MIFPRSGAPSIFCFKTAMKYLIGKKIGMTQRFLDDGKAVAVTVVEAGPCRVTQVRTKDRDGYEAVQIGFDERKNISKPEKGHLKDLPQYAYLEEFPQLEETLKRGDTIHAGQFVPGDPVDVTGISKGRGFQGVVKRHHFGGSPATHGHKDQLRMPGSIGATEPQRVFKGTRMAGHMGDVQVTAKNLEIVEVDAKENLLFIKGAIPGANGKIVSIFSTSITKPEKIEEPKAPEQAGQVEEKKEESKKTDSK